MLSTRPVTARTAAGLALAAALCLLAPAAGARVPPAEIMIEGGGALPGGDLDRSYELLDGGTGFGAETGYEIGARFRYWFTGSWAVSPSFHYVNFGDFIGTHEAIDGEFEIGTSIARFGADVQAFLGDPEEEVRPFLTVGAGLYRNRYRDELIADQGFEFSFNTESFNTLGLCAGGGLRMGSFEFSAVYHLNRFDTSRLLPGSTKVDFDWDYVSVRFGLGFTTE